MNKNEVFAHFSSILDDMLYDSLFFCTYFQQPTSTEDFIGSVDDESLPENLQIRFGATRGVIIDDYYDYVVKFDVEEDGDGLVCEREESIYKDAIGENLNQYFAECCYLGTYTKKINFYDCEKINHFVDWYGYSREQFEEEFMENEDDFGEIHEIVVSIPLYGYPKAQPHRLPRTHIHHPDNEYEKMALSISSPLRSRNLCVAIDFIKQYGLEEYERLSSFLSEEGVNDLHCANCADLGTNYVLIDYGGYHDGSY